MADISKIKPNGSSGTEYDIKDATARSALENKANNTQTFTEASTRTNIASGETMSTLFGKIKKFFTDLKTVAFTGSYNDLSNKPTIPAAQVQSDWNQTTTTAVDYIKNKPTIPAAQIQSDWNQTDTTKKDYIKNKPTIPTVPGVVSTSANGLAPKVTNTSNYLKGDGTWSSPANNAVTVTNRTGSSYNNNYPVVFGTNTGTGTVTEGLQKRGGDFTYNPYSEKLSVYQETVESTLKVGVANSSNGYIDFHRSSQGYRGELQITTGGLTADQNYYLPDETGTLATREYLNSNLGVQYQIKLTTQTIKTKVAIAAHSGSKGSNCLNSLPSVTAPTGYTFTMNMYIEATGAVGAVVLFDGTMSSTSVNPFIFNAGTSNWASGTSMTFYIVSLFTKS